MSGRIKKSHPKIHCTDNNYRDLSLPHLMKDFECRCAYSMVHMDLAGGESSMEVDHFKPKKKFPKKANSYSNLMLASRHCNGKKGDAWPTREMKKLGFEFINPCKELDYGNHIFEEIETGKLVGATNKGWYQIDKCMLNAPHLIRQRRDRTKLLKLIRSSVPVCIPEDKTIQEAERQLKEFRDRISDIEKKYIPYIPPPRK